MSDNIIDLGRMSYAANDPTLPGGVSEMHARVHPVRSHFQDAADPLHKAQQDAIGKSERARREESGVPRMIKLHKPVPELKPNDEFVQAQTRSGFNQSWLKEQRTARLAEYADEQQMSEAREREAMESNIYSDNIYRYSGPSR